MELCSLRGGGGGDGGGDEEANVRVVATLEDVEKLWPYYNALIDKYFERGHKGKLFF